ncbi:hypothetical protein LWI28_008628 [Acer negundo]|uniref:Uncharacterized protein n=1 Tax=Acer negundo TaxID=4023 RepID=A0AAD5J4Z2_ACENE|nr:hypothetical protein LWI28_008628 [Acer negundo]
MNGGGDGGGGGILVGGFFLMGLKVVLGFLGLVLVLGGGGFTWFGFSGGGGGGCLKGFLGFIYGLLRFLGVELGFKLLYGNG